MDWQTITLIILVVLLLLAGGYIKRLMKEIKDLVSCFTEAIQDDNISKEELAQIIKEAKEARDVIVEIVQLVIRKRG